MDNLTPITREEMLLNDEPLTPITREEKILAGEDLECVTRREYFLKKYRHAGGDVMVEGLSVTENGTYTAPEGKAYSPVEVAVPLPENAYLLKEASGSLVSFSDGADLPMPSFICNIDAVQDLHGQDDPWVGGAGKNKLQVTATSQTINGITYTVNDDGTIKASGTANDESRFNFGAYIAKAQSKQIMNGLPDSVTDDAINMGYQGYGVINKTTRELVINRNTDTYWNNDTYILIKSGTTVNNLIFKPMIRLSSVTDATFAPYSNICPISGHTGLNAAVSPTTEASAGTTYSISWQAEAGEVFGGYVDLVSGVLTAVGKYKLFDGSENWTITSNIYLELSDMKSGARQDGLCNYFPVRKSEDSGDNLKIQFGANGVGANRLFIINAISSGYDTLEKVQALTTGMQIVYPLAEPITYQLTPTQIKSLKDDITNAWCSTGDVDIDYFAKEV